MTEKNKITTLNGRLYYKVFLAGAANILKNQSLLNSINLFPVPDADTGSNLSCTLRSIIDLAQPFDSFALTSQTISDAAIKGSRGSSGLIFAQFLYGLSVESKNRSELEIRDFSEILENAVNYLYDAVTDPAEGTILTFIKDWASAVESLRDQAGDFTELLILSTEKASKAFTKNIQGKDTKPSNISDAGARGFLLFLEGVVEGMKINNTSLEIIVNTGRIENIPISPLAHKDIKNRFSVDALIKSKNININELRSKLKSSGDCIIIAGDAHIKKIHANTGDPEYFVSILRQFGSLNSQHVDDMLRQNQAASGRLYKIALVTDSTSDLPSELVDKYQIYIAPLNIYFGENQYLDKLTIGSAHFFRIRQSEKHSPTTSQPDERDFLNLYTSLTTHYDSVISIHVSREFSSTFENSTRAAKTISNKTGKRITVLDSWNLSGSLGLLTLKIAQAIDQGSSHEDIITKFPTWRNNTRMFVSIENLNSLIREKKISTGKGVLAKILNLKPLFTIDQKGLPTAFSPSFRKKTMVKKVLKQTKRFIRDKEVWNYIILHADKKDTAEWYSKKILEITGKEPVSILSFSPSVELSTGKGSTGVAILAEEKTESCVSKNQ